MQQGSRDEMKKQAKLLGAKVGDSITGKTDMLVCGEKVGAAKLGKARALGVQLLSEAEYLALITIDGGGCGTCPCTRSNCCGSLFGWLEQIAGLGDVFVGNFIDKDQYGFRWLIGLFADHLGHAFADFLFLFFAEGSGNPDADVWHDCSYIYMAKKFVSVIRIICTHFYVWKKVNNLLETRQAIIFRRGVCIFS